MRQEATMSKGKSVTLLSILLVIVIALSVLCFVPFEVPGVFNGQTYTWRGIANTIKQGIDLKGGYYVVLSAEAVDSEQTADINNAVVVLRKRLDSKGYTEATITTQDTATANPKIRIEIPEVDNANEILQVIGSTGELRFTDSGNTKTYLTGSDVVSAKVSMNDSGKYIVALTFTAEGGKKFASATEELTGKTMNIYLGDQLLSSPTVNTKITGTTASIESYDTYDEADAIASVIDSGKLPLEFSVSEAQLISASLGQDALKNSLIAGAIGLAIIFVIMIVCYGGLGFLSCIALYIYTLVLIMLLAFIPGIQLTLPGIAGILLSIGMAIDANVVIFERIKEEYAAGKTVTAAIQAGFNRAVITVIDANVTTIIAAIVLWIICPGSVKGFAITLFIGVLLSMVTAIFVTRWLIKLFRPLTKKEKEAKFLGLKKKEAAND